MNSLVKLLNRNLVFSVDRVPYLPLHPRFLSSTNVVFDSQRNIIARKLGIPQRPKKPLTGYFRFMKEIRPSVGKIAKNPKEVSILVAAEWKKLDNSEKEKYNQEFKKDLPRYQKEKEAYEKHLSKEQMLAIKDERIRMKELKEIREHKLERKNRLKELGKPKRPINAFLQFFREESSKAKINPMDAKTKYDTMNESQKNVYKQKAAVALVEYRKALQDWEKQMISKGLTDVIGKKPAVKLPKLK